MQNKEGEKEREEKAEETKENCEDKGRVDLEKLEKITRGIISHKIKFLNKDWTKLALYIYAFNKLFNSI